MLRELTSKKAEHDYRLKVLWIEDDQAVRLLHLKTISRYFKIWRARTPEKVADRVRLDFKDAFYMRADPGTYDLPCLPVDGFLADFDLSAAAEDAPTREIEDDDKSVHDLNDEETTDYVEDDEGTDETTPEARSAARDAEAAGLTTAVLTALNFEGHPSVIVPYTGRQEQLSSQRALIRLLAPSSIIISDGSELDLGKVTVAAKLQQFAIDYREALLRWAGNNIISIPSKERTRLKELAARRASGEKGELRMCWDDDDIIVIDTSYGRRGLSCAALWYRVDGQAPTLAEVSAWIEKIPTPGPVYAEAVELAARYWSYSRTDQSRYRYILSRLLRERMATVPSSWATTKDDDIRMLCDLCGVSFEDAVQTPEAVKLASGKFVQHLFDSGARREVIRLAVFMLLTLEYAARWAAVQRKAGPLWEFRHPFDYKDDGMEDRAPVTFAEIEAKELAGIDLTQFSATVVPLGFDSISFKDGEILLERERVRDSDMAQRLDPLPEQLLTTEQKFSGERIFQRLKSNGIKLKELITGIDGWGPEPHELREVQYYAKEIDFPPNAWPEWLRKKL